MIYQKNKWNGKFIYSRSITNQSLSNLDAKLNYDLNDETQLSFRYQNINKLPNNNYNLYQSSYVMSWKMQPRAWRLPQGVNPGGGI